VKLFLQTMSNQKPLPGSITWRDLTIADAPKLRDFYQAVAGWMSEEYCGDFNMLIPSTGEVVAGICHARGANVDIPPQWLIYINVPDVAAAARKCLELGGKVVTGPRKMGGGDFAVIQDPAGAVCALYCAQSNESPGP
jgi:predicted enzyme related to lactoylglutathione lyase